MTAQEWKPCETLQTGDTLKWNEPLWAIPNKPRGKRDKIGEQEVTATLLSIGDVLEFKVISVTNLSLDDTPVSVQKDDYIKRKESSLEKGNCQTLSGN